MEAEAEATPHSGREIRSSEYYYDYVFGEHLEHLEVPLSIALWTTHLGVRGTVVGVRVGRWRGEVSMRSVGMEYMK